IAVNAHIGLAFFAIPARGAGTQRVATSLVEHIKLRIRIACCAEQNFGEQCAAKEPRKNQKQLGKAFSDSRAFWNHRSWQKPTGACAPGWVIKRYHTLSESRAFCPNVSRKHFRSEPL